MNNYKVYDEWNIDKKSIQKNKTPKFFVNIREIWFTKMGKNIGFEEDGKDNFLRPVLVIKKVGSLFFTVALTSKGKENNRFYLKFKNVELIDKNSKYVNSSYAVLSQVKVMDKRRFTQHIGTLNEEEFVNIKQKLRILLF